MQYLVYSQIASALTGFNSASASTIALPQRQGLTVTNIVHFQKSTNQRRAQLC